MRPKRFNFFFSWGRRWITRILPALLAAFISVGVSCHVRAIAHNVETQMPLSVQEDRSNTPVLSLSSTQELVEQGRTLYEAGRFSDAVRVLEQAVSAFAAQGDGLRGAIALSNLSLAYQQLGQWQQADKAIQESLNLLQNERSTGNSTNKLKILAQALEVQGRLQLATGKAESALDIWQQATSTYEQLKDDVGVSRSSINQSQAMQALGLYRRALKILIQANQTLQNRPDSLLKVAGLRSLGDVLRVVGTVEDADQPWQQLQQSLGIDKKDNLEQSWLVLQQSLAMARNLRSGGVLDGISHSVSVGKSPEDISAVFLSLGDTARALYNKKKELYDRTEAQEAQRHKEEALQQWVKEALNFYQQTANTSTSPTMQVQGQLNQFSLLLDVEQWLLNTDQGSDADAINWWLSIQSQITKLPQIQEQVANLPPSRTAVEAQINLTQNLIRLKQIQQKIAQQSSDIPEISTSPSWQEVDRLTDTTIQHTKNAIQQAKELKDQRSEADVLGTLGGLYEQQQNWFQAQSWTETGLKIAQSIQAWDIAYELQWQLGRIYKQQNNIEKAIAAYEVAVETLKEVRSNLLAINLDLQFSFRDNAEPIYRELVELLLPPGETKPLPDKLQKSVYFIESLQLAELENFLQCNLQAVRTVQINRQIVQSNPTATLIERINQVVKNDPTAALIYPIILKQQVAVILKLPGQENLLYHTTTIDETLVKSKLNKLRILLRETPFLKEGKDLLHDVYTWLIEPFEAELEQGRVKNLVFVLDGSLRDIPMAALYNQREYLVQKPYNIALAPSVQLLGLKPSEGKQFKALIAGVTEERKDLGFPAIPLVKEQTDRIKSILSGSVVILDNQFTKKIFEDKIKSPLYTVIHLATHGIFSSNLQDTFILTGDDKININELGNSFRARNQTSLNNIQLLVLSACETAKGDKRASLGIAGVAVKSGAGSTIAPLWFADQESTTALMVKFYEELVKNKTASKAEALHLAQKSLLEDPESSYKDPRHWATFVLVGDWL